MPVQTKRAEVEQHLTKSAQDLVATQVLLEAAERRAAELQATAVQDADEAHTALQDLAEHAKQEAHEHEAEMAASIQQQAMAAAQYQEAKVSPPVHNDLCVLYTALAVV